MIVSKQGELSATSPKLVTRKRFGREKANDRLQNDLSNTVAVTAQVTSVL